MKKNNFIKKILSSKYPYIIAEIGINHNGKINLAKKMILEAKKCGANCVKFQKFIANDYISKFAPQANYQKQHRRFKNKNQRDIIDFLCTPFETKSLKSLLDIGIDAIKISSDNLNNISFLKEAANSKLPVLLSTGMGSLNEVKKAVKIFKKSKSPLVVLQCTSNYPSKIDSANVSVISSYKKIFKCLVGYSDHTNSNIPAIAAVSQGAMVIEKHFTLSRKLQGIDQKASIEPAEFIKYIKMIREAKISLGDPVKKTTAEEKDSIKSVRRSIVMKKNLLKNSKITKALITVKRPGIGISPDNYYNIIGKKLKKNKKEDEILFWKDLKD